MNWSVELKTWLSHETYVFENISKTKCNMVMTNKKPQIHVSKDQSVESCEITLTME